MLLRNTTIASLFTGCIQHSLCSLILFLLTLFSATYFIYSVQPMNIFHKQIELSNPTSNESLEKNNNNDYHNVANNTTGVLLETEEQTQQLISTKNVTGKILLCEEEKVQSNQLIETLKKEKGVLEANATVYRDAFTYVSSFLHNTPYHGVKNYTRYTMARLGMLPLPNAEQLKPEFGPVINDFLSFRYRHSILPCQNVSANRSIFIAVISAPYNFDKRNIIRQTWRNHLKIVKPEGLMGLAGFAFILGLTENNLTQSKIDDESKTYKDIIQIEMSDFYRNLSLKVAGLLNWLYRNCTSVDFVLKADDDVYVNVRNLAHFVQSHHSSDRSIFGTSPGPFIPNRFGKWTITFDEWPWNQYPPYFMGAAIIMPQSTVHLLFAASQTIPMMPFDDVYLTGICAEKTGVKLQFSTNSFSVFQKGWPDGCNIRRVIAWMTENINGSHVLVENFYNNFTHKCTVTDSTGINREVGHNESVLFSFN